MGKKKVTTQSSDDTAKKEGAAAAAPVAKSASAKKSHRVQEGKVFINATYNNTVVTVTDVKGNVIAWASAGSLGFAGPKKSTPFASSKVIAAITEKVQATGPKDISIIVKGIGSGRDSAIRSLINNGFNVLSIKDATPVPHNGPRPVKVRRV
jgi:small subunit ribosomal protein S11